MQAFKYHADFFFSQSDANRSPYSPRAHQDQDILFDEGKSSEREEPKVQNDFTHGRFKEDYMKLAARSKEEIFQQSDEPKIPRELSHDRFKEDYMKLAGRSKREFFQQSDEANFRRELHHGRFKEDYMKLKADSSGPSNVDSDESLCSPSADLQGPVAGCVTEWSIIMYGTA